MTDQEDNNNLGKIVFDDNNQGEEILGLFNTNLFQIADCVSVPTFVILLIIFGCFWRIHLSKICDETTVWVGTLCSAAG